MPLTADTAPHQPALWANDASVVTPVARRLRGHRNVVEWSIDGRVTALIHDPEGGR